MIHEIVIAGRSRRVELEPRAAGGFQVRLDGREVEVDFASAGEHTLSLRIAGRSFAVTWEFEERTPDGARLRLAAAGAELAATVRDPRRRQPPRRAEPGGRVRLAAPMAGKVVRLLAGCGEVVAAGQGVLVLEAMKMQNEVRSPKQGVVVVCHVTAGATVATGQLLAEVE